MSTILAEATDTADLRKARGAFFTPELITRYIVEWAVRTADDRTMEPSCGEASFMLAAADRLRSLGAKGTLAGQLNGVELHGPSAEAALALLREAGCEPQIEIGDFFDASSDQSFDAVVGNPPYVRYQDFTGASRLKARQAALEVGVSLTGLASSWAAFTVQSARLVSPEGRLGLVLPAELLSVNYAGAVRRFLMERFASINLVMFEERVFPDALEEVVLLLAEGRGPADHIKVSQARNLDGLPDLEALPWTPDRPDRKWTPALLAADPLATYTALIEQFVDLEAWGRTDLGMVTGNNRFFTMTHDEAIGLGFAEDDEELQRISPPGSKHLRGLAFTDVAWSELGLDGRPVYLFRPPSDSVSDAARSYIAAGEDKKVHKAYKCKVRDPWWRVPWVAPPDLFLTYMNHDTPRLVTNLAGISYLNSVHGVTLNSESQSIGRELLPLASLNSLTLLGAELVGRSYGGGMLKVEPREADILPVPSLQVVIEAADDLRSLLQPVALLLQRGQLIDAVRLVDKVLLTDHLGASPNQIVHLREGHGSMFGRRAARGGK